MPVGGLNTGIDVSLVIFDPNLNANIVFGRVTGFDRKQQTVKLKSDAINGPPIFGTTYDGWTGTISVERNGPFADQYFARAEANYYAGLQALNVYILETIKENNGFTQYRYNGVDLDFSEAGRIQQKDFVRMTITWRAATRTLA